MKLSLPLPAAGVLVLLLLGTVLSLPAAMAQDSFQFGVIGHSFGANSDDAVLRRALADSDAANLAFVVVNGIKSSREPCTDTLYGERRELLEQAQNGVIVSLAASDWVGCRNKNGTVATERLNRVRELFFDDEFSFGATKLPLLRQSITPKFRSYAENARWEFGDVLFATINIPAANNHFLQDGGRNSEFEDRLIANKDWLQRLFKLAGQKKLSGIVLFCDGNPLAQASQRPFLSRTQRDGYAETRQRIIQLAAGFHGKVLLVHGENLKGESPTGITWHRNLGSLGVTSGWVKLKVDSHGSATFTLADTNKAADAP